MHAGYKSQEIQKTNPNLQIYANHHFRLSDESMHKSTFPKQQNKQSPMNKKKLLDRLCWIIL
jgi:hypothetical protein